VGAPSPVLAVPIVVDAEVEVFDVVTEVEATVVGVVVAVVGTVVVAVVVAAPPPPPPPPDPPIVKAVVDAAVIVVVVVFVIWTGTLDCLYTMRVTVCSIGR